MKARKKKTTKKPTAKRKRNAKKPTAKQLAARRKFAALARARAKAAKKRNTSATKKRAAKRTSAKATKKRATKKRNKTIIKKAKKVIVLNPKKKAAKKKRTTKRNPQYTVEAIPKYTSKVKETVKAVTRGAAVRKVRRTVPGPKNIYRYRVEKNPTKKRNPSQTAIDNRKEFAGKYTGDVNLYFPQKTLKAPSTLGPLVLLKGEFGTIKPTKGGVYYCQDGNGRIHIGAKTNGDLWAHVKENLGQVHRVEYRAAKPHLGYPKVMTWYHDFEAPYPVLKSDGKGGLMQVGGGYKIRREGIVG